MIKKTTIILSSILFILLLCVPSCEKYVLPSLHFSRDTIFVNSAQQQIEQTVECNVDWTLSTETVWAEVDVLSGFGSCTLHIDILENTDKEARTGVFTVTTETIRKKFLIVQYASEKQNPGE